MEVRQKIHNRLDSSGRKARHFTETGALLVLTVTELGLGNQAYAREAGTHQGHIQGLCKEAQHIKPWKLRNRMKQSITPSQFHHCFLYSASMAISHQYDQRIMIIKLKIIY